LEFDVATFVGTAGRDTLLGGRGEVFTFFLGSAGNDLYGVVDFTETFSVLVDYSGARKGVVVDKTYVGKDRTFTDENGEIRTVSIVGKA
jgi:hypothetical protein